MLKERILGVIRLLVVAVWAPKQSSGFVAPLGRPVFRERGPIALGERAKEAFKRKNVFTLQFAPFLATSLRLPNCTAMREESSLGGNESPMLKLMQTSIDTMNSRFYYAQYLKAQTRQKIPSQQEQLLAFNSHEERNAN